MNPKYHQFDYKEDDKLDLRQAKAVLKYKPDIIILEYPNINKTPNLLLNKYPAKKKPKALIKKQINSLSKEVLKTHPWAKADKIMWENISKLWDRGHQVLIYTVDAPTGLTQENLGKWPQAYPAIKKNWLWWVQIYLREKYMTKNIQWVLDNYHDKDNPTILIFLQSFHWKHVKYLLSNPTKKEIWNYYFNKFNDINRGNIKTKIKSQNKVFYKYWDKISDFK